MARFSVVCWSRCGRFITDSVHFTSKLNISQNTRRGALDYSAFLLFISNMKINSQPHDACLSCPVHHASRSFVQMIEWIHLLASLFSSNPLLLLSHLPHFLSSDARHASHKENIRYEMLKLQDFPLESTQPNSELHFYIFSSSFI